MKMTLIGCVAMAAIASAPAMAADNGAQRTTAGYEAIVAGDMAAAEMEIASLSESLARDPAHLINAGFVHWQAGRLTEARQAFLAARDHRRHYLIETADGSVADTRAVASRALARLQNSLALR